jgi:hypothetical protein
MSQGSGFGLGEGRCEKKKKAGHYSGHFANNTLTEYRILGFAKVTRSGYSGGISLGGTASGGMKLPPLFFFVPDRLEQGETRVKEFARVSS